MPVPVLETSTVLRLVRIGSLVAGSLIFLWGCEVSRRPMLTDVWTELVLSALLGLTALVVAWFEVARRGRRPPPSECRFEVDGFAVRVRIVASGELVFRGREFVDSRPEYEWAWTFHPDTFPAIRAALDGKGHLLAILDRTVPQLDPEIRQDPGAWLYEQGIPAAFRERGVSPTRITADLPIVEPAARPPTRPRADRRPPAREQYGTHRARGYARYEADSYGAEGDSDRRRRGRYRLDY
ncbi:hypothetical protein [Nocardia arthritidis]|uniref:Uncharacterized protein n=1 Tax=Nocardia arthritidis TaxID=228602 RepID=A0A6G9YNC0_9NOCA|nr:hypothetical protein [Nocardia arthritidis]QIS14620.1 hypothetical protein F5544_33925 [Nocardia arthritidis]